MNRTQKEVLINLEKIKTKNRIFGRGAPELLLFRHKKQEGAAEEAFSCA